MIKPIAHCGLKDRAQSLTHLRVRLGWAVGPVGFGVV